MKSKYTRKTIRNLENAREIGHTINTACKLCGISRETYYSWIEKRKDFKERMDMAYGRFVDFHLNNIHESVTEESKKVRNWLGSKWLLEVGARLDFGPDKTFDISKLTNEQLLELIKKLEEESKEKGKEQCLEKESPIQEEPQE